MLYSVVTPMVVLLSALAVSYAITRPIGDMRRHIAAILLSLALSTIGGFVTTNMGVSVIAALGGAFVGIMLAWRRRHPLRQLETHSRPKHQDSRRPHYGISRA
jgi:membrane associated rhomboid family serine protease